jgi:hypothetical protein
MKTRTIKVNGPIRLTTADIAKLSPAARAQLGISEAPGAKGKGQRVTAAKSTEKLFKVSWYSARLQKRVSPPSYFEAHNKSGAIAEAKAAVGYEGLKRRKLPLPANFIAQEVRRNGQQTVTRRKKNPQYTVEATPIVSRTTLNVKALTHGGAVRAAKRSLGKFKSAYKYRVEKNPGLRKLTLAQLKKKNPGIWADLLGGLAGGIGYAAAAAYVQHKLEGLKKAQSPKSKVESLKNRAVTSRRKSSSSGKSAVASSSKKTNSAALPKPVVIIGRYVMAVITKREGQKYVGQIQSLKGDGSYHPIRGRAVTTFLTLEGARKWGRQQIDKFNKAGDGPAKSNPQTARAKIREGFLGRKGTGRTMKLFTLPGGPKKAGALAKLASIELMGGKVQNFPKGAAYIGGIKRGKLARMVIGLKQPFTIQNGLEAGKAIVIGEVKRFDYWARKPHLYGENSPEYRFTHKAGEEGGRRPLLVFHNGAIGFRGGDYKIQPEGVRD